VKSQTNSTQVNTYICIDKNEKGGLERAVVVVMMLGGGGVELGITLGCKAVSLLSRSLSPLIYIYICVCTR
jgi:hypothetical protein